MTPNEEDGEELQNSSYNNTRRQFVAGSAGALGGLAAGGALVSPALAQEDDEDDEEPEDGDEEEEEEEEEAPEGEFEDDVDVLNYALTLEYLEAEFYRQALENISQDDLCNCRAFMNHDNSRMEMIYGELETIQAHEEAHVDAISQTIEDLDGEPIETPEFEFGMRVEYPMPFFATAAMLEDLGVAAYAGAAPYVENEDILAAALGIHSVEARHASFIRTIAGQTGFPNVVDTAQSRADVEEMANAFIVGEEGEPDDVDDGEPEMPDEDEDENGDENGDEDENGEDDEEMPDDETDTDDNGTDTDDNGTDTDDNGTDTDDNGTNG